MKVKKILFCFTAVCFVLTSLYLLQRLLMPKYMSGVVEGSLIEEYYKEKSQHDVVFIGDCEVYENISPITLWEKYGITSYIRGSAQQLTWQSYYLLEDTLKYEKPKVVVFNVLSMKYNEPQKEAYNRMTLDGMKMSPTKLNSVKASMTKNENMLDYIFPILRYHSRWSQLTKDDFKYIFNKDKISNNGYYMRADVKPAGSFPKAPELEDYEFGKTPYNYLDRMTKLCKENNIKLVLVKAPSLYPYWYPQWDAQMEQYAKEHNLTYINFLNYQDETGINYKTDTYDGGLHLNVSGAEKLTDYFGNVLSKNYKLEDHRNDKKLNKIWQEKIDFYNKMKKNQYSQLEKYGHLTNVGVQAK